MRPANPLLIETWRGLVGSGDAQFNYLGYLSVQAIALMVWWPWGEVHRVVHSQTEPKALLAVVIALGATLSLQGIRAGSEEILLPGQHPLREWMAATRLGAGRILIGYLAGHLLATCHLLLLSMPLVIVGYAVASAQWQACAWAVGAIVLMSTFYRLAGALLYLLIGHRGSDTFMLLRVLVVAVYAITPFVLPAASHPLLAHALLIEADSGRLAMGAVPGHLVFVTVYAAAVGLLTIALYLRLSRHRDDSGESASTPGRTASGVNS